MLSASLLAWNLPLFGLLSYARPRPFVASSTDAYKVHTTVRQQKEEDPLDYMYAELEAVEVEIENLSKIG